ncbi:hypothetical protein EZJ49_01825 [Bdellovibrio bacteriovorus]|uniref:hypothetical protein n=1 Tax=Bdellovibrio bacteriovorus TaxID=959 RepID=UPI0021CEA1DB|nr:hypothetical protein [Bdellovibrio bacteriovorus]UXR64987.1 hypothetical protein EZJ49_01825 [Bdellovibrio bacteriovorus]
MSGNNLERQQNTNLDAQNSPEKPEKREPASKKSLFGNLNTDLKNALDTWETLTEEMTNKISPEEEQLQEVKRLLGELKSKLNQFDE